MIIHSHILSTAIFLTSGGVALWESVRSKNRTQRESTRSRIVSVRTLQEAEGVQKNSI